MNPPIIFAHRGASGSCPENTLLAFRRALEIGALWLELDVQLCEGQLVVFHDDDLARTTNGRGRLADWSFAELRKLDAGQGERIPLLDEVLDLARGRAQVNIELKGEKTGVPVAELLERRVAEGTSAFDDVLISSFLPEELRDFQQRLPQVRRAPICEELPPDFAQQLEFFAPWSLHLDKALVDDKIMRLARDRGCKVFCWTVNSPKQAERLFRQGVQGIFTDFPERFIEG